MVSKYEIHPNDARFHEWDRVQKYLAGRNQIAVDKDRYGLLHELLQKCEEYFDQRADADQPSGAPYPIPNEEMRLLIEIRENVRSNP